MFMYRILVIKFHRTKIGTDTPENRRYHQQKLKYHPNSPYYSDIINR